MINRGQDDDVELGMRFQILSKEGEEILDPETGEVIEEIPYEKTRVEVEELYSRAAIAKTYETHFVGGQGGFGSTTLSEVFGPRREMYETFPADLDDDGSQPRDMTVRAGDRIRQIPEKSD